MDFPKALVADKKDSPRVGKTAEVGDDPNRQAYRYLRQTASVGDRHHIQFDADCNHSFLLHPFIGLTLGGLALFFSPRH